MKKVFLILGIMSSMIIGFVLQGQTDVQAQNENMPPKSINLDNIFTTPTGSDSTIVQNKTTKKSYVQVTPDTAQNKHGAIWSTTNNKMDLTKDFEASMYVYFGGMRDHAADGMAFVMKNDGKNGNTLIKGTGGQIGVWASEAYQGPFDGIQNSFAVEFDPYYNAGFDYNVGGKFNHLAWGYPGKESTYKDTGGKRVLNHNDVQNIDEMSNDKWYSFNVKWDASKKTLQYQYSDKPTITVKIDPQDIFGGTSVDWGFTGSTGDLSQNAQVAFAKVPGLVEEEGTETVTNSSGDVIASQDITGKKVSSGDILSYKIGSKYTGGKQDWVNVLGEFNLDGGVTYQSGTLKMVRTAQDGKVTTTTLPDSAWSGKTLNNINFNKLGKYSKDADTSAYITFDVKTGAIGMVNQTASTLTGDNYIGTTNTASYEISKNKAPVITLADTGKTVDITDGAAYDFKGTWKDIDSDTASLSYSVDNGTAVPFDSDIKNDPKNQAHEYSGSVPSTALAIGTHKVSVYATDVDGAKSNVETVTINSLGLLQFANVPKTINYGSAEIPTGKDSVVINRGSDWDVRVKDTRKVGSHWHVALTLTEPFTSGKGTINEHVLKDALIYKTATTETEFTVGTAVNVYDTTTVNSNDVDINWANDQGVLMVAHSADYAGAYTSVLNWALVDAP